MMVYETKKLTDEEAKDNINVRVPDEEVKDVAKGKRELKRNIQKIFGLVWNQCTHSL